MSGSVEILNDWPSHCGRQLVVRHGSNATGTSMTFALFLPGGEGPFPLLTYLSGLTCTHANVMEKGEYRAAAAEHGIAVLCPDTSPRGEGVADDEAYDLGQGASFYVDATEPPWTPHFRMRTYIEEELPALIAEQFPVDLDHQSISGHSMGGHGALSIALRNPGRFRSISAFAPIVAPMQVPWGRKALTAYLGPEEAAWRACDATALIEDMDGASAARVPPILIDQGNADQFLEEQLRPHLLEEACKAKGIDCTVQIGPGDHSYYTVSTHMPKHIAFHARHMRS